MVLNTPKPLPPTQPAAVPTAQPAPVVVPVPTEAATPVVAAVRPLTLDELTAVHRRGTSLSDAELRELAEGYRQAQATAGDSQIIAAIQGRIEHIQLTLDTRARKRALQEQVNAANQRQPIVLEEARRWRQSRVYTMVGRLSPSLLYDGVDLPKMYRIESVGNAPGGPRTLGYVLPDDKVVKLEQLGQVVGVVGQQRFDPALRLLTIAPEHIDVLTPEP